VLPVPFAFSRTGVLVGLATALVVAAANAWTGTLLLRAAGALGCTTFEGLAHRVGGEPWKASKLQACQGRRAKKTGWHGGGRAAVLAAERHASPPGG
jgi:hypothetical protein